MVSHWTVFGAIVLLALSLTVVVSDEEGKPVKGVTDKKGDSIVKYKEGASETTIKKEEASGNSPEQNVWKSLVPANTHKLISSLERSEQNPYSNAPAIGGITETMSGLNYIPRATKKKFSSPFYRMATGGTESVAEVNRMVEPFPSLAANMPGMGNLDLSALPPDILVQVLHGGEVPGMDKTTLEIILRDFTSKMYVAALAAKNGQPSLDQDRYLPPLQKLPKEIVSDLIKGGSLPYLNKKQMSTIREYYMGKVIALLSSDDSSCLPEEIATPQLKAMIKMLPPGYDTSKLSEEVLKAIANGKMPDLNALPADLQNYLLNGGGDYAHSPEAAIKTIDDVIRDVSHTQPSATTTYAPYDINKVTIELRLAEKEAKRKKHVQFYSTLLTCVIGAISSVVLVLLFVYMRRRNAELAEKEMDDSAISFETSRQQRSHAFAPSGSRSSLTAERPRVGQNPRRFQNGSGQHNAISLAI